MSLLGPEGAKARMAELQQRIASFSAPSQNIPAAQSYQAQLETALRGPLRPMIPGNIVADNNTKQLQDMARTAANEAGVDPDLFLALVEQESSWKPDNVNKKSGATGLTQLMPGTAKEMGVTNPLDPQDNLRGGAKYLRSMLDRYGDNVKIALAAYNAGPANVDKAGGIPDFPETNAYVTSIMRIKSRGFGLR